MKATELRKNIYSILDEVINTGKAVTIERKGHIVKLLSADPVDKFGRIKKRKKTIIKGSSDDLPDIHWEKECSEEFI